MLDVDEIPEKPTMNTFDSFLSGLVGVKVRLQSRELASRYGGTWNCFVTTIKQEKAGVAGINALVFSSYTWFLQYQEKLTVSTHQTLTSPQQLPLLSHVFIAGIGAGIITSFVSCPMELVKVQLQNQTKANVLKGPLDCFKQLYARGGVRYWFKGLVPTTLRELSFGPYFLTYEIICREFAKRDNTRTDLCELSGPKVVLAGGTAGIVAWCSTYFADVLKTRIQSEPSRYKGIIDCTRQTYSSEGWRIFFRGLTPTILRAFPSNAATFAAYTWTMNLCQKNQLSTLLNDKAAIF
ncbi:mitochondrial carrier domain-containing protein [Mycotypha africana]|uniref:mitochondrial carrier domain-containing protein n=1 Tax=Mycotypha africana TaxID=64632 RepID=UPI002301BC87|nr:mitochondrial carrier domain-containing protein [Mycotypha africana]KAI8975094.1 mitochondrial carrier domain-containing protein [Mycotypha africana]